MCSGGMGFRREFGRESGSFVDPDRRQSSSLPLLKNEEIMGILDTPSHGLGVNVYKDGKKRKLEDVRNSSEEVDEHDDSSGDEDDPQKNKKAKGNGGAGDGDGLRDDEAQFRS